MIKLNQEAEKKHQQMLELQQQADLLTSQLEYAKKKN